MKDCMKDEIISSIKDKFPDADYDRIKNLLELILLEIESYNVCGKEIPFEKLQAVISEVLYRSMKNESEQAVSSIKRGDTTISYATSATSDDIKGLLLPYEGLIQRIIGCGGLVFY